VIIGVTGSVGKTSVKEAIFAALDRASRGHAHRSVKSYNNHVGVPLSLARMPAHSRYGIFEMGMNHAGEIDALTRQVRPHIAVITTIAPAHIEMLGSEEAIADAKAEIFAGLEGRGDKPGVAIIPADSPHFPRLKAAAEAVGAQVVSFGRAAWADVRLLDAVSAPGNGGGSLITIEMRDPVGGDRRLCYTVAAAGEHWVINSLAVMAAARAAGADLGAVGVALAEMEGLAGRGARRTIAARDGGEALLIDESYNANPASMRSTLAMLGQIPARRRIAVLGAMKELGDFGPALHAQLAGPLMEAGVDIALLVGEEMLSLADELGKSPKSVLGKPLAIAHCRDSGEAAAWLADHGIASGDAILVKGSNSVGLGALVASLAANGNGC
jgi:UDP-N-acetylmuramoyl-tripeptide--D-alanyl-D-alanine ligase